MAGMPAPPLRAFSDYLFELRQLAQQDDPARFLADAVHALRRLLPYRSAWWGEMSPGDGAQPPQNWLQGTLALAEDFAAEWAQIARTDEFAHGAIAATDKVVRDSGYASADPRVTAFCQRHDLGQVMAITLAMPESGLLFFVSLYRGLAAAAFSDDEAELFAECGRHLQQAWRHLLQNRLQRHAAEGAGSFAMARQDGSLLFLGGELLRLFTRSRRGWSGHSLPPDVVAALHAGPTEIRLGAHKVSVTCAGELILLQRLERGVQPALAPRLRAVALRYAQGASHKDIAAQLQISPATVRTYLRDCYLMLGVRNKVALGVALTGTAAAARRARD
jgi:DNA-binding CsgD family transcriptional regulator